MTNRSTPITSQPRAIFKENSVSKATMTSPFENAICERNWSTPLWECNKDKKSCILTALTWPYHTYTMAIRLGESPFLPCLPCGVLALRVKVRTLLGIKGSVCGDFGVTCCCHACVVCQMRRELDTIGL